VVINLVGAATAIKTKPIANQRGNELAGSEIPKLPVVNAHQSDRDRYARLDSDLYLMSRFLWEVFAVLKHAIYNHAHDFVQVLEGFALRRTPG
jgi:hypothetical protein